MLANHYVVFLRYTKYIVCWWTDTLNKGKTKINLEIKINNWGHFKNKFPFYQFLSKSPVTGFLFVCLCLWMEKWLFKKKTFPFNKMTKLSEMTNLNSLRVNSFLAGNLKTLAIDVTLSFLLSQTVDMVLYQANLKNIFSFTFQRMKIFPNSSLCKNCVVGLHQHANNYLKIKQLIISKISQMTF